MRFIEVKQRAYGDRGEVFQETRFRQFFTTKAQQVKEQEALFPAVAQTVQEVMSVQDGGSTPASTPAKKAK